LAPGDNRLDQVRSKKCERERSTDLARISAVAAREIADRPCSAACQFLYPAVSIRDHGKQSTVGNRRPILSACDYQFRLDTPASHLNRVMQVIGSCERRFCYFHGRTLSEYGLPPAGLRMSVAPVKLRHPKVEIAKGATQGNGGRKIGRLPHLRMLRFDSVVDRHQRIQSRGHFIADDHVDPRTSSASKAGYPNESAFASNGTPIVFHVSISDFSRPKACPLSTVTRVR
jgi:hypothetical protein